MLGPASSDCVLEAVRGGGKGSSMAPGPRGRRGQSSTPIPQRGRDTLPACPGGHLGALPLSGARAGTFIMFPGAGGFPRGAAASMGASRSTGGAPVLLTEAAMCCGEGGDSSVAPLQL